MITQVNIASFTSTTVSSVYSFTLPFTPTNGNTLVLTLGSEGPNANYLLGITQTGATWANNARASNNFLPGDNTLYDRSEIWSTNAVVGAGTGFTLTHNGPVNSIAITVIEYSGLTSPSSTDQQSDISCNVACGAVLDSGTTPLTTQANELWIANFAQHGTSTFSLPTSGFAILNQSTAGGVSAAVSTKIVSVVGNAHSTVMSTTTENWTGGMVTLKQAPPVPPPPPPCHNRVPLVFVSDYITELRNRFAEINFDPWVTDDDIIGWLNLGVDDIVFRTLPPRYEVYPPFQFSSVAGQTPYNVPGDFYRLKEFGDTSGLFYNGEPLLFEDKTAEWETFQFEQLSSGSGPVWFWFWSNRVFVYPPPTDNTGIFKMYYYRLPEQICSTGDVVDLDRPWTESLIKFVCWKALEKDKHPMAQVYRQQYEQAISNVYSESRIRVEKRARYVHSHDFYGREDR